MVVDERDTRLGEPPGEALTTLEATLRARGDFEALLDLLRALERGPKLVRVVRLDIEPELAPAAASAVAAPPGTPNAVASNGAAPSAPDVEALHVTLVVQGFAGREAVVASDTPTVVASAPIVALVVGASPEGRR